MPLYPCGESRPFVETYDDEAVGVMEEDGKAI
jgi:hypothetical protein